MTDDQPQPFAPVWETPPPGGRRRADLDRFVDALKNNPDEWARMTPAEGQIGHPNSRAQALRNIDPHVEAVTRAVPNTKSQWVDIWARWRADLDEAP